MARAKTATSEAVNIENEDPWKRMYRIKLPRAAQGEENFIFVSVNCNNFKIKKGETVEIPEPVYEVLENSYEAQDKADEFLESVEK